MEEIVISRGMMDIIIGNLKSAQDLCANDDARDTIQGIMEILDNQMTDGKHIIEDNEGDKFLLSVTYEVANYAPVVSTKTFPTRKKADKAYSELMMQNKLDSKVNRVIKKLYASQ